jgi:hypothetical protein
VGSVTVSKEILTDSWTFERGQTWQNDIVGATVRQSAPACIARNINSPEVRGEGEKPFVFATRFPNGAVAVAAQQRTTNDRAWYMPICDVTLSVGDAPGPYGIFGDYRSLTLISDHVMESKRVLAQDLAGEESVDISNAVQRRGTNVSISGEMIRRIGLQNATPGDLSSPGLVIAIR